MFKQNGKATYWIQMIYDRNKYNNEALLYYLFCMT